MGTVFEWYGYRATDASAQAAAAATQQLCPFLGRACTKKGGVCSVVLGAADAVAVCPNRMYFDDFAVMRAIAAEAFGDLGPEVDAAGLPVLAKGADASAAAAAAGRPHVGVFGKEWGGEVKLPPAVAGSGEYSIDYLLVVVDPQGELRGIVPVEVQTIDTTGSYQPSIQALASNRRIVASRTGMNWENVNKRILPQLIVKGLMLQAEALCRNGIFFLTPSPVYDRIMMRLGGAHRLRRIPRQPGSITFVRMDYGPPGAPGAPVPMVQAEPVTVSTSDLSLAFVTPENLPPAGAYEERVRAKL